MNALKGAAIMTSTFPSSSSPAYDASSGRTTVAIVTGASNGIGLEAAKRLIAKGYPVVANSRNTTAPNALQSTSDAKLVNADISVQEIGRRSIGCVERNATAIKEQAALVPRSVPEIELEYFDLFDPETIRPVDVVDSPVRTETAIRVGETRLIDNGLCGPLSVVDCAQQIIRYSQVNENGRPCPAVVNRKAA
jgi:hypothetical protein